MPEGTPYIIYKDTIFVRKIEGGFELVPTYNGEIDLAHALPQTDYINRLLKRRKFKGKKTRFTLLPQRPSFEGEVLEDYEALPDWGITAALERNQEWDQETIQHLLNQENVLAIAWVDGEDIEYALRSDESTEPEEGQA